MSLKQAYSSGGVDFTLGGDGGTDRLIVPTGSQVVVQSGGLLSLAGNQNISGTVTFGSTGVLTLNASQFNVNGDGDVNILGTSGHTTFVDIGPYVSVSVAGPSAAWTFSSDSSVTFSGTSGHTASLVFGNHVAVDWQGAASAWVNSAGSWSWTGGSLSIGAGVTVSIAADVARTGSETPSGTGAKRYLRDTAPSLPDVTTSGIDLTTSDFWVVEPGLAAVAIGVTKPSHSYECVLYAEAPGAWTNDVTVAAAVTFGPSDATRTTVRLAYVKDLDKWLVYGAPV